MINQWNPLYRCYGTIREMLGDRGYTINDEKMTPNDFFDFLKNPDYQLKYTKQTEDGRDWVLQVFFVTSGSDNQNMGKKVIETYKKQMEENNVDAAILLLKDIKVTSYAKNEIESYKPTHWIECFNSHELQINKTKHKTVPKHELLSKHEKERILQKYSIKADQLPKVFSKIDPIARYFAAQPGQVFAITKESESSGIYTKYRIVI